MAKTFQNSALRKYNREVSMRNPLKEPIRSTKMPAPTVPIIAAIVPAVFDIPDEPNKTKSNQSILKVKCLHLNSQFTV